MAPPKRYWVKLKISSKYLSTLPKYEPPVLKSRLKKIAAEEKKLQTTTGSPSGPGNGSSKTSSPQPDSNLNYKINSGLKEMSTSGLTMNPVTGNYPLDKTGKPATKWIKRSYQFKTFSGFKVRYQSWAPKDGKHQQQAKLDLKQSIPEQSEPNLSPQNSQSEVPLEPPSELDAIKPETPSEITA